MRRVAIIGGGGAGKTTLALELGRRLDLPVVHINALNWRGRSAAAVEGWLELHASLVAQERWIIEGMKPGVLSERLARADPVVFLDLPRRACLRGIVARRIRFRRRPRPETGRPDRVSRQYVRWVWRFGRAVRPGVLSALSNYEGGVVVVVGGGAPQSLRGRRLPTRGPPEERQRVGRDPRASWRTCLTES